MRENTLAKANARKADSQVAPVPADALCEDLTATRQSQRTVLDALMKDPSYEASDQLLKTLQGLGENETERSQALKSLFSETELKALIEDGLKVTAHCYDTLKSRRSYKEGVEERLKIAEDLSGGRDSWGYRLIAEPEDVIDDKKAHGRIADAHGAINNALNRVRGLYGTMRYGNAYHWVGVTEFTKDPVYLRLKALKEAAS